MLRDSLTNIFRLGLKELRSLGADTVLLVLIIWAFTGAIYSAAKGVAQELRQAPVAVVDEDRSPLSQRLVGALTPPYFRPVQHLSLAQMDAALDHGKVSFVIMIPANFQRDFVAGRRPTIQVNIDATIMTQSFIGASYIRTIFAEELNEYLTGRRDGAELPVRIAPRVRFNPNLTGFWFGGVMETISNITMLTIILVGAAFIREREHGTLEHLLVMPLTPFQILVAKIWANGLAVLIGAAVALIAIIQGLMAVPIAGSIPLFLCGAALYLFSAASIGIFLATLARSMPQFGLLVILTIVPLELLSGGVTPRESMPEIVQNIMQATPTPYFVRLAQGILYRGAIFRQVWPDFLAIAGIGTVFFTLASLRFRRSVSQSQG
ncbi:ABC transporter permease [Massilia sp. TS11]|uniref:ABC transporter permease n=1 Tax=Massilia sp. TS11 TaxID=2908003 RepID=UPI001EDA675B|nr:ABC transporter permease [Massilia sp. TS11]MCG2586353.1 ABC transporter permease [Massilia sp. TS11]